MVFKWFLNRNGLKVILTDNLFKHSFCTQGLFLNNLDTHVVIRSDSPIIRDGLELNCHDFETRCEHLSQYYQHITVPQLGKGLLLYREVTTVASDRLMISDKYCL